ncbi:RNA pseudouridine synthase [Ramlibacter ginsenosidimutans]|uniref:Dual-specificity RNA pseudouridine synthase RluA n=1 Tax=Ramlibacter ginsenosidimutans TaxID=502333 RepID=A0A934TWU6_9BURK|nr:pseudouridine synthase [Ramlibacter ginsenosidimutans]MBK6008907.1 RNA pseudouridine synthase [Ramlibacter ginsenosidimutans]
MHALSEGLVFVDDELLVLDKPAGLLAVPGRGEDKQDCLSARAQALWPDALVVHRLDMATSGLFLMGRGLHVQRVLSRAFAERRVRKGYEAIVAGVPGPAGAQGLIELPLAADWPNRPRQQVDREHGRPSVTRWQVQAVQGDTARLALEPLTGRTHQLRVHLQAIGHPILGDALYAPPDIAARAPRLLLHACTLELAHPASGEPLRFESAAPF